MTEKNEGVRSAEERIRRLERESHQIRGGAIVLAVLLIATWLAGRAPVRGKILEAEKLIIVDKGGKERATLSVTTDQGPELVLKDQTGEARLRAGVLKSGEPQFVLFDDRDIARAELALSPVGSPQLSLRSDVGEIHLWLALDRGGNGALLLRDEEGLLRAMLGPTSLKTTSMKERQDATVVLLDKTGKVTWAAQ